MRLRKNMKRTAAAVLALSMAVSAVAAPASAAYICNVSQGNVEVSVDSEGNKTIKVGDKAVEDNNDGTDDIIITGDNTDNTKPAATESLNAAKENADEAENAGENTSEVEKSGENSSEVEKSGETKTEGKDKTQNSAAEGEGKDDEPTTQELLAPEDEQKKDEQKDEQKPAETQETEQAKPADQVLLCGQNDPEADKEATKLEAKPVVKQEAGEKKSAEEKIYEDNAPTTISEKAQEAARNVVSIINNSASVLKVILRDLKVDAGDTNKSAVTISSSAGVKLELEGKNELTGGSSGNSGISVNGSWNGYAVDPAGKLTIQGKEGSSLSATGGSATNKGGYGIVATELDLVDATVTATGGAGGIRGGDGVYTSKSRGECNIKNSKLVASGGQAVGDGASTCGGTGIQTEANVIVGEGSEVIAIGGSGKAENGNASGGNALAFWWGGYQVQKGGKLTATGGNAESEKGKATGGAALNGSYGGIVSAGETTLIGGNAKSGSGNAVAGDGINGDSYYFSGVTVKEGTFTAAGGKAESATSTATNGNSVKITPVNYSDRTPELKVEEGGTFVTAKPGESEDNGNGITGTIKINTDGGKIEEVENAKVVKKDDGTVEVVGDLVGVVTGNLKYELTATVEPTCTTPGKRVYTCTTEGHKGEPYEETIDALGHDFVDGVCNRCGAPEQAAAESGGSSAVTLTVTGAEAYETSIADGRYTVAVPAETAVLSGSLGNLKELKAQGVNTIVFRTQLRETVLNIDSMLSLGVDDTLFTLTHNGEGASLTIGGFEHSELIH